MGYYRRHYPKPYIEYRTDSRGRIYKVNRGGCGDGWDWGIPLFIGVMLAPFTYLLSIPVAALVIAATTRSARHYD